MKNVSIRWRIVAISILCIVLLSILYSMVAACARCWDKKKLCRLALERLALCVRDRRSICAELNIDGDCLDLAIGDNPSQGMAMYCKCLNMPLLVVQETSDGQQRIIDPWGRPFKIQARGVMHYKECCAPYFRFGRHCVRIWSVGPNGVDDRGEGDDIVMQGAYVGYESFALLPNEIDAIYKSRFDGQVNAETVKSENQR